MAGGEDTVGGQMSSLAKFWAVRKLGENFMVVKKFSTKNTKFGVKSFIL